MWHEAALFPGSLLNKARERGYNRMVQLVQVVVKNYLKTKTIVGTLC